MKLNDWDAALDAYIEKCVAEAPPLTTEQRTALAELLRPVRVMLREERSMQANTAEVKQISRDDVELVGEI